MASVVRKPFLIAGVRDPVALYVSLGFEAWALRDKIDELSVECLRFWVASDPFARIWDDWFLDELGAMSGVDVYARPFPTDRGWDIYENLTARVLVIRQENLAHLPEALGALYGFEPSSFRVETCNVGANKGYASRYDLMKRTLRFTDAELDTLYESRFGRHFYTQEEIARFKSRWRAGAKQTDPDSVSAPAGARRPQTSAGSDQPHPGPACGHLVPPSDRQPHIRVCRPCWRCEEQLNTIPGLLHTCAVQAARIEQLEAAEQVRIEQLRQLDAAYRTALASSLRTLARRVLPKPLRALARRILLGRPE
jgi:hypothetical protein